MPPKKLKYKHKKNKIRAIPTLAFTKTEIIELRSSSVKFDMSGIQSFNVLLFVDISITREFTVRFKLIKKNHKNFHRQCSEVKLLTFSRASYAMKKCICSR